MKNNKKRSTRTLSKTKLLACQQCPKRLWLELYQSSLEEGSAGMKVRFVTGHHVRNIARTLYDLKSKGTLRGHRTSAFKAAFAETTRLLSGSSPIVNARFSAGGAVTFRWR
jgi:hypothetical protein